MNEDLKLVKTRKDISGQVFGQLTVIKRVDDHLYPSGRRRSKWQCQCSCGKTVEVINNNLTSGNSTSCGCRCILQKTHGLTRTTEYKAWLKMLERCNNPRASFYKHYGGRGIKVCDRWKNSFENFLEDMGNKPTDLHSLERVDVNGNYCPENCIWETQDKQARNCRKQINNSSGKTGVHLKINGRYSYYVASWRELNGRHKNKTFSILKYGEEEAFKLASDYRDKMIEKLNSEGAGYSVHHGL